MKLIFAYTLLPLVIFHCFACSVDKTQKNCAAIEAYHAKKNQIVTIFSNKSIFKRGDMIILDVYKNQHISSFYFLQQNKGKTFILELMTDSLQFGTANDFDFIESNELKKNGIKKSIELYTSHLLAQMDSLAIKELTSEFSHLGIDLQLFCKDESMLIYISSLERITNSQWRTFIFSAKKIDQNWYYYPPK